jgi:hypothetical protein
MKKVLGIAVFGIMFLVGTAFAREVITQDIVNSAGSANITVAGVTNATTTVYSKAFVLDDSEYNTISYYANSATGSIYVSMELEQSWVMPVTEGSSDGNYTEGVNMADIVTAFPTEGTWFNKAISAPSMKYGRVKITSGSPNNADTVVNLKLHKRIN